MAAALAEAPVNPADYLQLDSTQARTSATEARRGVKADCQLARVPPIVSERQVRGAFCAHADRDTAKVVASARQKNGAHSAFCALHLRRAESRS